jgi:hypothetical protein
LEKISFGVPYSYAFFEEKSVDGCPKQLKIYLLGHDGCEQLFAKYAENVEYVEFFGCFEYPEMCFRVCSQLKKLKDLRFLISGSRITEDYPVPKKVKSWDGLRNPKVVSLRILTDVSNFGSKSTECKTIINKYLQILLDYSKDQLPSIRNLRLELPDTDEILAQTRALLRLPNFSSPRITIVLDESVMP